MLGTMSSHAAARRSGIGYQYEAAQQLGLSPSEGYDAPVPIQRWGGKCASDSRTFSILGGITSLVTPQWLFLHNVALMLEDRQLLKRKHFKTTVKWILC
jgi:hypothetical protein